ncbi:uncharacterized protein [Watersipora subatra]|uniref:uncharacterized protein isoform X2 n=1 Tax=Watersipora subatra TaxID=2589382 RepID=UPI00355BD9E4
MAACRWHSIRHCRKRASFVVFLFLVTSILLSKYSPAAVILTNFSHHSAIEFYNRLVSSDTVLTISDEKESRENSASQTSASRETVYNSNKSTEDEKTEKVEGPEEKKGGVGTDYQNDYEQERDDLAAIEKDEEIGLGANTDGEEHELGADSDEEELEAIAQDSNDKKYVKNVELEKYYNDSLLTFCELAQTEEPQETVTNHSLTLEECRTKCSSAQTIYALLSRGKCRCSQLHKFKPFLNLELCNATCKKGDEACNVTKKPHRIIMRTGMYDGDQAWTTWMHFSQIHTKVRYRGCARDQKHDSECLPEFQRTLIHKVSIHPVSKYLIGCFTAYTITANASLIKNSTKVKRYNSPVVCRKFCEKAEAHYAYLNSFGKGELRQCLCTNTLARSQPTDSCTGPGYGVYWTKTTPIKLTFTGEAKKAGKVLVLARYRSGSSMTQSFFIKNPKLFALFEPGKLKASPPKLGPEETDRALLMALEAVFSCNLHKVHTSFHNSPFLRWSNTMLKTRGQTQNYMSKVLGCMQAMPKVNCGPHWLEACQMSEFINVKVIRVFSVASVKEFIERNSDVHVVHLVRDPRALLSAQKKFGAKPPDAFLCNQMIEVGKMILEMKDKGRKNAHEVFYEQLALNSSFYGMELYREMGLEMPEAVENFLSRDNFDPNKPISKNAKQVVMKDPKAHIYGYIKRFTINRIMEIDTNCQKLYEFWPSHYMNFSAFYKNHGMGIDKYVGPPKKQQLQVYFN